MLVVIIFSAVQPCQSRSHVLARPVMSRTKAGIQACVAIEKKDEFRRGALRQSQKTVGKIIRVKEPSMAGRKRKQQVMEDLATSPTKQQSVESSLIGSQKTGSKEVNAMIASFFYENGISFNVSHSSSFGCRIDESIKFVILHTETV